MAARTIKNGELITLADGEILELSLLNRDLDSPLTMCFIEVISSASGVYFASGEAVSASVHRPWPAGSKFPFSYKQRTSNISCQGTAADTFVITW